MTLPDFYKQFNKDIEWINHNTVYLARHGSRAYNTHTPESDEDFKGICIPTKPYFLGSIQRFEQAELKDPDTAIYEIRKFFKLAAESNPNIIEVLYVDDSDVLYMDEIGKQIREMRDQFLSKRVKHTFMGYAISQLKRIKLHRRYLLNPPTKEPTRTDFGLPEQTIIPRDQLMAAEAEVRKEIDRFHFDFMEDLTEPTKISIRETVNSMLSELKITSDVHWNAAARKVGLTDNFIEAMQKERAYKGARAEWEQYHNWKKTRNKKRFETEEKYGYDCYSSDTEFLTENGWKLFDDINNNDKLATVFPHQNYTARKHFGVEYQNFSDKFDAQYNGPMYHFTGQHMDTLVTSNHRMLIRKSERASGKLSDWSLEEASAMPDTFEVLRSPTPNIKNYSNQNHFSNLPIKDTAYLSLMGWFLSDGCTTDKSIRISQRPDGKLSGFMKKWNNKYSTKSNSSLYLYDREPTDYYSYKSQELLLDVRNPFIFQKMKAECGVTKSKRIPRYVFSLSKRMKDVLIFSMIRGDGTKREHKTKDDSYIYYSVSKDLANDIQELAFLSGWETALWGPFETEDQFGRTALMYQVHLRPDIEQTKLLVRSKNVKRIEVKNHRVVCFSVPNGTLITRRDGKISIHGNCKHGYHLVRLCRMCEEILTTGKVIVRRHDRDELMDIRNGKMPFDVLMNFAEQMDEKLQGIYEACAILPRTPDFKAIDKVLIQMIERSFERDVERAKRSAA